MWEWLSSIQATGGNQLGWSRKLMELMEDEDIRASPAEIQYEERLESD